MNHVPQATGCPHEAVEIPFLVTERFQHVIWSRGELTVSWESNESSDPIISIFHENPTHSELISGLGAILDFYQARSYFGLLAGFYLLAKRQFDLKIYLDRKDNGRAVVTTELLLAELYEIASVDEHLNDDAKWQKYLQIDKIIREAENFTSQIQRFIYQAMMDFADKQDDLLPDLWDKQYIPEATAMLYETLSSAAHKIYRPSAMTKSMKQIFERSLPMAPYNMLYVSRFMEASWCPGQAQLIAETTLNSRSALFALSSINRRDCDPEMDHSNCSTDICVYDNIDNDTYQTYHTPDCDKSDCPMVPDELSTGQEDPFATISNLVRTNCIPLIRFDSRQTPPLIIASHVPAKGDTERPLRKRKRNQSSLNQFVDNMVQEPTTPIPRADSKMQETKSDQVRIHSLIPLPTPKANSPVPYIAISHVWAQGLGNRRSNTLPMCQIRRLQEYVNLLVAPQYRPIPFWIDTICVPLDPLARTMAINLMRYIYHNAIAVLVVDSTLTSFDVSSSTVRPSNGFEGWQIELLMRIKASPWAQRLWTFHESCLANQLFYQIGGDGTPAVWSRDIFRPDGAKILPDDEDGIISTALQHRPARENSNNARAVTTMELEYTTSYLMLEAVQLQFYLKFWGSSDEAHQSPAEIGLLSRQLALRTTSRLQDEAICVSTLLGLAPTDIQTDIQGSPVPENDRMKRLWEVLPIDQIPAGILFCDRPFYGAKGCGWMVKSLLRDEHGGWIDGFGAEDALEKNDQDGLLVEMGGVVFEIAARDADESDDLKPGESRDSFYSSLVLDINKRRYRLGEVEMTEPLPEWREMLNSGKFVILVPPGEMPYLLNTVPARITGFNTQTPFGLLASFVEDAIKCEDSLHSTQDACHASETKPIKVIRRELVEFLLEETDDSSDEDAVSSDSDAEALNDDVVVEAQVVPHSQTWWVG